MAVIGLADLKAEFLRSIGYVGGLNDMETLYYEDVSGLVKVGYFDAIHRALSDLGCTQASVYDQLVCKYGTGVANLSPSQLEKEALETGVWGANYTGEVARFDPDQNAGATFWIAINGKTDRVPKTGVASQSNGTTQYWTAGSTILGAIGTGSFIAYTDFIVVTADAAVHVLWANGTASGVVSGVGFLVGTDNKLHFQMRVSAGTNNQVISDSVVTAGQRIQAITYRNSAGLMTMFVAVNSDTYVKQTDTLTDALDITANEDFTVMQRETTGTPGFFSDDKIMALGIALGVPDLTDAEVKTIKSPYDLRNLSFTDRAGWVFTERAGVEAFDIFGNQDLDATGHAPAWITGNTLRALANEVGFATSSDKAGVDIPISFDLVTPAFNTNITATFLGKVALRVQFAVAPVVNSDGLKTDGGQSLTDPDLSPELSKVTFPLVLNLDNQFSYGDVSVANRLAILIMFFQDTQAADYPADERADILLFIND